MRTSTAPITLTHVADIPELTGIRGVAALAVMFCHMTFHFKSIFSLSDIASEMIHNGWVAVQLFFILSGYIMAHNYPRGVDGHYTRFLIKRLARIYPLHFVTFLVFVTAYFLFGVWGLELPCMGTTFEFFRHLTMTQAWWAYRMGFWNTSSWSISAEFFAYLTFPFLVAIAAMPKTNRHRFLLATLIMFLYMVVTYFWAHTNNKMPWKTAIPGVLACFTTGLILYPARGAIPQRLIAILTDVTSLSIPILGYYFAATDTVAWPYVPVFAFWIYGIGEGGSLTSRVLATGVALFFGRISYALYLCHGFIIGLMHTFVPAMIPPIALSPFVAAGYLAADIGLIIAAATTLHLCIEQPARRYIVAWWDKRSAIH